MIVVINAVVNKRWTAPCKVKGRAMTINVMWKPHVFMDHMDRYPPAMGFHVHEYMFGPVL